MTTSFTYPFRVEKNENYKEILSRLNDKIDAIKKQVSYFDFYNISGAIVDVESFAAQINALPLNQGLVVNTAPFYYNKENYATGDVIIKDSLGVTHHIKAQTGGVYYPSLLSLDSSGTYTLQYSYADSAPTDESNTATISDGKAEASFAEKISFEGLVANNAAATNVYGEFGSLSNSGDYTFEIQKDSNNNDIWPFVQFFLCNNEIPVEQIIVDYSLTKQDGVNTDGETIRLWKVTPSLDSSINFSSVYIKVK